MKSLHYPLNVYACCVLWEEGNVDYLHYGLFKNKQENIREAQWHSTEYILQHLPQAPADILEVGMGLGCLQQYLLQQHYHCLGISPDCKQIDIARKRVQRTDTTQCKRFEDFAHEQQFDAVLLQESAQYIDSLTLFNKSWKLLVTQGKLLVLDEFRLHSTNVEQGNLHHLDYFIAQAQRSGFILKDKQVVSDQALPTLNYLLTIISKYQMRLQKELQLSEEVIFELLASLRNYQDKYQKGEYVYALLTFAKSPAPPRWILSTATTADSNDIQQLFQTVFNDTLSKELWHWKYAEQRGNAILAWKGKELVAHYAGMKRDILAQGVPYQAFQIGDVMVREKERRVLTKQGVFFLTGSTFLEYYVGYGTTQALAFGFPNLRAMRLGEKLGLYEKVGKMQEIHWQCVPHPPYSGSTLRTLENTDTPIMDKIWQMMQKDFLSAYIGVRDSKYLLHRYLSHPEKYYEVILVAQRFTKKPLGIIVLRKEVQRCLLLDFIAPLKYYSLLLKQTRRLVALWGYKTLYTWVSDGYAHYFLQQGGVKQKLDVYLPSNIWTDGIPPETIRDKWYFICGDTDFL